MSEITKENYLHEMFIDEAKPALKRHSGGGSSTPVPTGPTDNRTSMAYWYQYLGHKYRIATNWETYEEYIEPIDGASTIELEYPIGTHNVTDFVDFLSIYVYHDLSAFYQNYYKIPVKRFIGELDMSGATVVDGTFSGATVLEDAGILKGLKNARQATYLFGSCKALTTVTMDFPARGGNVYNMFYGCHSLANLTIVGEIECNGLSFQDSTKLTLESLRSILNALKDYSEDTSGTTWTVTLGATNIAKLSDDDLLIAEKKGWVIA